MRREAGRIGVGIGCDHHLTGHDRPAGKLEPDGTWFLDEPVNGASDEDGHSALLQGIGKAAHIVQRVDGGASGIEPTADVNPGADLVGHL